MTEPFYLQDLNSEQREAVAHGCGPLLIFAGAGSGKTRVLTRRIAKLIQEDQVHPARILAVTFTNKAAQEMKHRVASLFGQRSLPVWVSTFHSSCTRILRAHAELLDFTSHFVIYDSADSLAALKRVYKKANIDPREIDPRMVMHRIDRAKNDYLFPDNLRADNQFFTLITRTIAQLYEDYQKELKACNAMDFGDLLCNVITLFKLEPRVLQHYQDQFLHILIDEYQDTNKVQYLLVKMLTEKNRNISVVGDDDQSIYAFRGASVQNILNFKKDFPEAKVITLAQNYRSTKIILQAASSVIAQNKNRQKKSLRTDNPHGAPVIGFLGYDEAEEANFVTQTIIRLQREGVGLRNCAVFYRINAQSRGIEESLVENGIPYEIYGSHRFYERKEIKDILSYFKLLLNPDDNESFLRVINTPTRGLGPKAVGDLLGFATKSELSLMKALRLALTETPSFLSGTIKTKFSLFVALIDQLTDEANTVAQLLADKTGAVQIHAKTPLIADLLKSIAEKSAYLSRLKAEDAPEAESRIENLFELCVVAGEFVRRTLEEEEEISLHDFLDRTCLATDVETKSGDKSEEGTSSGAVSLMTLHLAKGLEFDAVFLIGLEEGLLPHVRSLDDKAAIEEERRLCYVGMTRARKRLYLTRVTDRHSYGRGNFNSGYPSRFIDDIPQSVIDDSGSGFLPGSYDAHRHAKRRAW